MECKEGRCIEPSRLQLGNCNVKMRAMHTNRLFPYCLDILSSTGKWRFKCNPIMGILAILCCHHAQKFEANSLFVRKPRVIVSAMLVKYF